jgi:hypothetical protein
MKMSSSHTRTAALVAMLLVIPGLIGCYTVLHHPNVVQEETGASIDSESSGVSCTDCHNNEYDHRWMSPHNWSFGYWGQGYPSYYYGYGSVYGSWYNYYYNPWWGGWYYDPWYYYPPWDGVSTPGIPSPDRPNSRRGLPTAPGMMPQINVPPPAYTPPPAQPGGGDQGSDDSDSGDRKGRRGKGS